MFMAFGPSGRDHDSQKQLYLNLETPRYFTKIKKTQMSFWKLLFSESSKFGKWTLWCFSKRQGPNKSDGLSNKHLKILNRRSITIKKHEMPILGNLEYGINLFPKSWNGNLGSNMGSNKIKNATWSFDIEYGINILKKDGTSKLWKLKLWTFGKLELSKLGNFETWKLWSFDFYFQ